MSINTHFSQKINTVNVETQISTVSREPEPSSGTLQPERAQEDTGVVVTDKEVYSNAVQRKEWATVLRLIKEEKVKVDPEVLVDARNWQESPELQRTVIEKGSQQIQEPNIWIELIKKCLESKKFDFINWILRIADLKDTVIKSARGSEVFLDSIDAGDLGTIQCFLQYHKTAHSLKELLEAKNTKGWAALHVAVESGKAEVIQPLIAAIREAGGSVKEFLEAKTAKGGTALHVLAGNGKVEMIRPLITAMREAGVSVKELLEAKSADGRTALHLSAGTGKVKMIQSLTAAMREAGGSVKEFLEAKTADGCTALHVLAGDGKVEMLQPLITAMREAGVFVKEFLEAKDANGWTVLHALAGNGKVEMIHSLIIAWREAGGSVKEFLEVKTAKGGTVLHVLAGNGKVEMMQPLISAMREAGVFVKEFLEAKDANGWTVLHALAGNGKVEMIQPLISAMREAGGSVKEFLEAKNTNGYTALHVAAGNGKVEMIQLLITATREAGVSVKEFLEAKNTNGYTALYMAVGCGKVEMIQPLITAMREAGGSVREFLEAKTAKGGTVLHVLAGNGKVEMIQPLISAMREAGVFVKEFLEAKDANGWTVLHALAGNGKVEMIQPLISAMREAGGSVKEFLEAKNTNGYTALHVAAGNGKVEMIQLLITATREAGVSVKEFLEAKNTNGYTALYMAVGCGKVEMIQPLITAMREAGGSVREFLEAKTANGWTAFNWAAFHGRDKIMSALVQKGATPSLFSIRINKPIPKATLEGYLRVTDNKTISLLINQNETINDEFFNKFRVCPEKLCAPHPTFNPLEFAFLLGDPQLAKKLNTQLHQVDFLKYLENLILAYPDSLDSILELFFEIDSTHFTMGGKFVVPELSEAESSSLKAALPPESTEIAHFITDFWTCLKLPELERGIAEKRLEYAHKLYPFIQKFYPFVELFSQINWQDATRCDYIDLTKACPRDPIRERGVLRKVEASEIHSNLRQALITLLYNVYYLVPFMGTPQKGTEALRIFYHDIDLMLAHILKALKKYHSENPLERKVRSGLLLQLAEAGNHCGGRYVAEAKQLYSTLCLKRRVGAEDIFYDHFGTERRLMLDRLNQTRDTHEQLKWAFLLEPQLGLSDDSFKDPIGPLATLTSTQLMAEQQAALSAFGKLYTQVRAVQSIQEIIQAEPSIKEAYVKLGNKHFKERYSKTLELQALKERVEVQQKDLLASVFALLQKPKTESEDPAAKIEEWRSRFSLLDGMIKGAENLGVARAGNETPLEAVLSAEENEMTARFLFTNQEQTKVNPYALIQLLCKLNIIKKSTGG